MVLLIFPCRPRSSAAGTPLEADACSGHACVLTEADDTCIYCGHYSQDTIRQTWAQRAQRLAA